MKRVGGMLCLAAVAVLGFSALAQTPGEGLRDAMRSDYSASTPRPYSLWTPSALRTALLDGPMRAGGMPNGFAVQTVEVRIPSPAERAVGLAYRVDVILNGPMRAQSITFRLYDTPEAARGAVADKTLGDRGVTLTRESLEQEMTLPNGGACARVRSAAFSDLVFMRCYRTVLDLPVIVSGATGVGDYSLIDAQGAINIAALDDEMKPAAALMAAAALQVEALVASDPDGKAAYVREMTLLEAAKAPPPPKKR